MCIQVQSLAIDKFQLIELYHSVLKLNKGKGKHPPPPVKKSS